MATSRSIRRRSADDLRLNNITPCANVGTYFNVSCTYDRLPLSVSFCQFLDCFEIILIKIKRMLFAQRSGFVRLWPWSNPEHNENYHHHQRRRRRPRLRWRLQQQHHKERRIDAFWLSASSTTTASEERRQIMNHRVRTRLSELSVSDCRLWHIERAPPYQLLPIIIIIGSHPCK